ncbi:carboxymuconolactone decarboxylase family protein [Halodesulfurarchaeum sp.]|uniref:carboxymuconolactone decarboxylase family protein n=1 Tax=Halodesulfurarchaeum sp. TaxID=1980530 RepID=UPI001BB8434D|nr:carboxymuconolactone decarboxylase family protein [Halodesulfurarchaeum sp.]
MSNDEDPIEEMPSTPRQFAREHPDVWAAYSDLGEATAEAGPLAGEQKRLVKLAISIGAQSEGAVHSHVRRGLDDGVDPAAMRQVAILSIPTVGFPAAMAALSWINDLA